MFAAILNFFLSLGVPSQCQSSWWELTKGGQKTGYVIVFSSNFYFSHCFIHDRVILSSGHQSHVFLSLLVSTKQSCSRGTVCVSPPAVTVRHPSEEISIFGRFLATKWKQVVEGWGGNPVPLLLWIAGMLLHTINHNKRRLLCFCAVRKLINAKHSHKGFAYVPLTGLYQLFGVAAAPVLKRQRTGWSSGCTCRSDTALPWALTGLWPDSLLNWKISLQTERFVQPEGRRQNIRSVTS